MARSTFVFGFVGMSFLSLLLASCASSSAAKPDFEESEVLERIDGASKTPEWASGRLSLLEEQGQVIFIGTISMAGDSRPEACMRGAEETSRANLLRRIKDSVTVSGQVAEFSSTNDPGVEALTTFFAAGNISGVMVQERYWEKRVESTSTGARVLMLHCAAKVALAKSLLERQVRDAIGGAGGDASVREKLLEAQKKAIEDLGK